MTDLRRQLLLLLVLQVLAFVVLGGPLLATGVLVNDRLAHFSFFRDTLHSLNVYGDFPWWNPSIRAGFPFYYIELLFWPGREPLFAAIGAMVWLLGRLHVTIESYQWLYVAYIAFLVPLLLSLSVFLLARQILRRPLAVYLVIALMAFSPGVVFSISDLGIEVTAYGFFFCAALLHFLRTPGRSAFVLLCLATMALAMTPAYFGLHWNIFFVPVFVLLVCVGRRGLTRRTARAFRRIPGVWLLAAAAGVALCALPSVITYGHGADILSSQTDGRLHYEYRALRSGTPLEALAISTPGVGFEWTDYDDPRASFAAQALSRTSGYISFGYMGLLTLPLVCMGLVAGRPYWSIRLYGGIAGVMTIMLLSGYSPVFSLLLAWLSPLRGINHYSDAVLRVGLFALFVLAAGLGLESVLRSTPTRRWILAGLFAVTSAASVVWLVSLQDPPVTDNYLFGMALALILLYAVGLARFASARTAAHMSSAVVMLLALVVVDTSTLAFAHLRFSHPRYALAPEEPGADTLGSVVGKSEEGFLHLRGMDDLALLNEPARPVTLVAAGTDDLLATQDVTIVSRTYNGIMMRVSASQQARLEWHDAYFPFWRAWVNGVEVPIDRTPQGMKAVPVPAGASDLVFRFSPTVLRATVAASYLTLAAAFALWLLTALRARRHHTQVSPATPVHRLPVVSNR